jgi:hypothetical protein
MSIAAWSGLFDLWRDVNGLASGYPGLDLVELPARHSAPSDLASFRREQLKHFLPEIESYRRDAQNGAVSRRPGEF